MRKNTIISLVHLLIQNQINKDSVVIDATLGNGHDTNFIAPQVKHVYGFDVLNQAIVNSKKLNKDLNNITYILDSHANFENHIKEPIDLIIYNLGYLPGFDKEYTTQASSTLISLQQGLKLLKKNAKMIITIYIGHDNGKVESSAIEEFVTTLNKYDFDVLKHQLINKDNYPPYIIEITKKTEN